MMVVDVRKSVLLRLRPEVLAAVDKARGAQERTAWLVGTILRELDRLERGVSANGNGHVRSAFSEDEISSEEPSSEHEYSQATDANGGSGLDGEPSGDPAETELSSLEGSDTSALSPPGDDL